MTPRAVPPRRLPVSGALLLLLTVGATVATGSSAPGHAEPPAATSPAETAAAALAPADDCPGCVADVAIYDPAAEEDGVWEEEVRALAALLKAYGWTYRRVDAADVNTGALTSATGPRFRALAAPGGWSATRARAVTTAGDESIRAFVAAGGGYLGLCAGAYWASDPVVFAGRATGGAGTYNRAADYRTYPYDLRLLDGAATGPFGWTPWSGGNAPTLERTRIETSTGPMAAAGMPSTTRFLYAGGPYFSYRSKPAGWQVWARAKAPSGTVDAASAGDGKPTVVSFRHGSGRVVLFAYHPDVLVHSDVDRVHLDDYWDEDDIDWDRGGQSWKEINTASWNIVHAAVQTVLREPVTPVTRLP